MGKNFAKIGISGALLAAIAYKSNAKTATSTDTVVDVLNFAQTLEYLEASFYTMGASSAVILGGDMAIFNQIKKHELSHVTFLKKGYFAV